MSTAEHSSGQKRPPVGDDGGGGKRPALDDAAAASHENVCWLCLDAVHESGLPLRRDCSCRGGSGFAHLPCIVEYAKDWSQKHERADFWEFAEKWRRCHNCKQEYMGDLRRDLANELISFAKDKYAGERMKQMKALYSKLLSLEKFDAVKDTALKILSLMLEYLREEASPAPVVFQVEAMVYRVLGKAYYHQGTKESAGAAVEYLEKSLILHRAHIPGKVSAVELELAEAKAKYDGAIVVANEQTLKALEKMYDDNVKKYGREAIHTIYAGMRFASYLSLANHRIESERLMTQLAVTSEQANGVDHKTTKKVLRSLSQCKQREVQIRTPQGTHSYQALRYEDEGKKLVVQGPIATARRVQDEKTFSLASDAQYNIKPGTPVVCNGLQGQNKLNGKIGDVRGFDEASGCRIVHFEEKELGEQPVQTKFLRILFELPEEGP